MTQTEKTFKLQKNADIKTKDLVVGFIKELRELLPGKNSFSNTPPLVVSICITYYYNPEYFAFAGEAIIISNDKYTADSDKNVTDTVYGNIIIDCKDNKNKYKWWFTINSCYFIAIGIDESSAKWINTYFYSRNTRNYAFTSSGDVYTQTSFVPGKQSRRYRENGTKVTMEFDLKSKTIIYYVNNDTQPWAKMDNIYVKDDISYRLAVFLWGSESNRPSSITLNKFEIEYQ